MRSSKAGLTPSNRMYRYRNRGPTMPTGRTPPLTMYCLYHPQECRRRANQRSDVVGGLVLLESPIVFPMRRDLFEDRRTLLTLSVHFAQCEFWCGPRATKISRDPSY